MPWTTNPNMRRAVEAGVYGTFGGWVGSGFQTTNTDGLPPDGSYFDDGRFLTIGGTDSRMVPPGYKLLHTDEGEETYDGDGQQRGRTPGRMIAMRKDPPAPPPPPPPPTPQPPSDPLPRTTEDDRYALARERAQGHLNKTDSPRLFASSPPPRSSASDDEQSTSRRYSTARFNHGFGQRSGGSASRGAAVESVAGFASSLRDKTTGDIAAMGKRAEADNYAVGSLLRRYAPTFPEAPKNLTAKDLIAMANQMNKEIKIS